MMCAIASADGKLPSGRQGREGRDFLSPLKQPFYRYFYIHERRPRAYARGGKNKNNGGVFSRPSRPTRPGDAFGDLRSIAWRRLTTVNTACRCVSGATLTYRHSGAPPASEIMTPVVTEIAKAKTVIPVVGGIAKTIPMPLDMGPMS
jgi:hypothetical protein